MSYSELLKDPRWQRTRLEILSRDNWTCQKCGSTDKTLHVHHQYYINDGRLPWEYNEHLLITLCHECHDIEESWKEEDGDFIKFMLGCGLLRSDLNTFLCRISEVLDSNIPSINRERFSSIMSNIKNG